MVTNPVPHSRKLRVAASPGPYPPRRAATETAGARPAPRFRICGSRFIGRCDDRRLQHCSSPGATSGLKDVGHDQRSMTRKTKGKVTYARTRRPYDLFGLCFCGGNGESSRILNNRDLINRTKDSFPKFNRFRKF